MSIFSMSKTIFKSLFSKPATLMYPIKPRVPFKNTRGHIAISVEDCILCGICGRKCPANAIKVTKADKQWEINPYKCVSCNLCVEVCPKKCLTMENSYTSPSVGQSVNVFQQAPKPEPETAPDTTNA